VYKRQVKRRWPCSGDISAGVPKEIGRRSRAYGPESYRALASALVDIEVDRVYSRVDLLLCIRRV